MDLNAASPSQLPLELVEKVLLFVPMPYLCQYRSVCKEWDALICNPAFAIVYAQNGKGQGGASFIAMEMQGLETLTWCLLDLNTRRWYTFYEDRNIISRHCNTSLSLEVAAMNAGLVCRFAETKAPMLLVFVHDLLGHAVKRLPLIKRHMTSGIFPLAYMDVDSTSHNFTIFLLNRYFNLGFNSYFPSGLTFEERSKIINDPLMRIYNSATSEWRSASNPPNHEKFDDAVSMVMCQGLLYTLMEKYYKKWIAYCYNPAEDAWKCANFCLSMRDTLNPQLIAINTRLFVASWKFDSNVLEGAYKYDFEVSEMIIPQMIQETLFRIPMPNLMELLEVQTRNFDCFDNNGWCNPRYVGMNVSGIDNALFLQSWLSGKAKVFDLDTRSWDHGIPKHPLEHLCSGQGPNKIAKQTNLLLPNSLQYLM